jgi:hypothetical protein
MVTQLTVGVRKRCLPLWMGCRNVAPCYITRGVWSFHAWRICPHTLASLAHNALGHFGFDKTYAAMKDTFYWPGMRAFLENSYIPSCDLCQRVKAPTKRPAGPLHPPPRCQRLVFTPWLSTLSVLFQKKRDATMYCP